MIFDGIPDVAVSGGIIWVLGVLINETMDSPRPIQQRGLRQ